MSISFKKINSMIAEEVSLCSELTSDQKQTLKEICQKIYMLESSVGLVSSQQTISDIKGEIVHRAGDFLEAEH